MRDTYEFFFGRGEVRAHELRIHFRILLGECRH